MDGLMVGGWMTLMSNGYLNGRDGGGEREGGS